MNSQEELKRQTENFDINMSQENLQNYEKRLHERLSDFQQKKVRKLAEAVVDCNSVESQYLFEAIGSFSEKYYSLSHNTVRQDWPLKSDLDENLNFSSKDPKWVEENQNLEELFLNPEFFEKLNMPISIGGGKSSGEVGETIEQVEEIPQEVEKKVFDVELTAFESGKKIAVIKDIKAMFGLGQKEAKEQVEKAPVIIKENLPKEEAEAIVEKLSKIGCTLTIK